MCAFFNNVAKTYFIKSYQEKPIKFKYPILSYEMFAVFFVLSIENKFTFWLLS